jgi:hypothetical protein
MRREGEGGEKGERRGRYHVEHVLHRGVQSVHSSEISILIGQMLDS